MTSFKRQNDVTPSYVITDVIFDHFSELNDVKAARAFRTVTLLFHITRFFNIGYIDEVWSNFYFRSLPGGSFGKKGSIHYYNPTCP